MNKTIEREYFKAFERGGTAYKCVEVIKRKYDLGYLPQNTPEEENEVAQLSPEEERERKEWEHFYNVVLPDQVIRETESFDFSAIDGGRISRIIEEIEANLSECNNEADRERYLFSLLSPFESTINFCYPIANIERLEQAINECKASNDQSEACAYYQKGLDRIKHIQDRLNDLCWQKHEKGTIEYCFMRWFGSAKAFSNRLDALLLTYGIDLLELQKKCGIYIKPKCRSIADVAYYIGSYELAQHYINTLPRYEEKSDNNIPHELNTDKAREVLKRGIDAGLLDNNFQPVNSRMTKGQMKIFALCASIECGIKKHFKVFETLWNTKNLAQVNSYDISPDRQKEIERLFPKEVVTESKNKRV